MITTPKWLLESVQIARVAAALPRWLAEVPLYQSRPYQKRCPEEQVEFLPCFQTLPIISKRDIRQRFPNNFLRPDVDLQELLERDLVELESTSGTAEEPTPLLLAQGWWNIQENAALRLNSFVDRILQSNPSPRRVAITSPACNHDICYKGVPTHSERIVGNSLSVNLSRHPFLWTEEALARMAEEAVEWNPLFLDVDPVYGAQFARYCIHHSIRLPSLQFILSSYEYLSVLQRQVLKDAFHVPVFNLYGSTETGHLLMEDTQGRMLPSLDTAFLELVNPNEAGIGELVVTTLSNEYMPLLRYAIGDLAQLAPQSYQSSYQLHGRLADVLRNDAGRNVTVAQIDACFADIQGIAHYQLQHRSSREYILFYVPQAGGISAAASSTLHARLAEVLATTKGLALQEVEFLPCESSGKFRLVRPLPGDHWRSP